MHSSPSIFLEYRLTSFRCFADSVTFSDTRHVNIVSGANNTGKSALMMPLRKLASQHHRVPSPHYDGAFFGGDTVDELRFEEADIHVHSDRCTITFLKPVLRNATIDLVRPQSASDSRRIEWIEPAPDDADEPQATTRITRNGFGNFVATLASQIVPVPARRHIGRALHRDELPPSPEPLFDGSDLLATLLDWLNPSQQKSDDTERARMQLEALELMMSRILDTSVHVRPVPGKREVEVRVGDVFIPLQRLGAGIEQVLILSAALVQFPSQLLLIEEPESFLHPAVQSRFLAELLARPGDSMVTTHSNHLLDIRDDRVAYYRTFQVRPGVSTLERLHKARKYSLLLDLGITPSSIFASNAVIWVEGPSDALYLRRWLSLFCRDGELVEGLHYSFAFHAGSLLASFFIDSEGAGPPMGREIVDFCSLHPNFYIVCDRDAEGSKVGHDYLQRLMDTGDVTRVLWVTSGKEIENYLPMRVFREYLNVKASPRRPVVCEIAESEAKILPFWRIMNKLAECEHFSRYPDKMNFAEWAVQQLTAEETFEALDLRDQMQRLVNFIRHANKMHESPAQRGNAADKPQRGAERPPSALLASGVRS